MGRQRIGAQFLLSAAAASLAAASFAQQEPIAVNHIVVNERLHTSGQPQPPQLQTLADRGFDLVVNLAPPTVDGAVESESRLLEESGVSYVNIPVDWRNPTYADFERFSAVMQEAEDQQVLVHCQVNARASTFMFLYRVVHEHAPPAEAFELVKKVWTPADHWAAFGESVLGQHDIDFEFPPAE